MDTPPFGFPRLLAERLGRKGYPFSWQSSQCLQEPLFSISYEPVSSEESHNA